MENYYEVQGYSPFATCGNDQCRSKDLCVLTSDALPSTSPSSPLHALLTPSTPGSQVPGGDSPCSPIQQVRSGISPNRGNASKIRASLPQATVEQNRQDIVAFCQQCKKPSRKWQKRNLVSGTRLRAQQLGRATGWIGSAPVQISGCCLIGALSC